VGAGDNAGVPAGVIAGVPAGNGWSNGWSNGRSNGRGDAWSRSGGGGRGRHLVEVFLILEERILKSHFNFQFATIQSEKESSPGSKKMGQRDERQ
jgi:hypothetical protein